MVVNVDSFPGRELMIAGMPHLYFGGTAYLGLQQYPEFQELFIENIKRYGTNYSASRISNVRLPVFETVEAHLAKTVQSEACMTFSSGYLAGQFISKFLQDKHHKFFYTPNTHSAVHQKRPKSYVTYSSLLFALERHLSASKLVTPVIFLDAIDFSGANYPDFQGLKNLPLNECILVVDDSHGIGVVGKNGQGVYATLKKFNPKKLFVCCSLGKGLGIQAGAIFGDKSDINSMMATPFFGGASPASPACMNTYLQAQNIYKDRRKVLNKNIQMFLKEVHHLEKFRFMPNHSVFSFHNPELVKFLKKHHMIITDFNYPNEASKALSRIVISAAHQSEDIKKLVATLNTFYS
ncbi:aminotransferase class I/II-fold pyridoxal phosphate-dependent enzyme [Maribacter aestuarii]|uniref:aminotransferase class I/II-fold pyridoxal phosphate-dependent enzyme n=1 Tax=Maribacter aestuarii TaxID=1130723 RepID=UPI00248B5760|nr:aminotransferase class I/II-fold pyridoxal phosphate-dependent enzyme [Maribacter aestuarii]